MSKSRLVGRFGLLTYFDDETVDELWARLARVLGGFPKGVYLADLRFARPDRGIAERAFDVILGAFVRGDPGAGVICIIEATANDVVGGEP